MTSFDRIHFGSCNSHHYENSMWPHMSSRKPSAFVWVGDAVYADDFEWTPSNERKSIKDSFKRRVKEARPEDLKQLYEGLLRDQGYRNYIMSNETETVPLVMGTFDDHDYGRNNGDRTYKFKRESAMLFLDFIEKSNKKSQSIDFKAMKRRANSGRGLFGVKVLDFSRPPGKQVLSDEEAGLDPDVVSIADPSLILSNKTVAIFVLDCRSNKTPWPNHSIWDRTISRGDFLGEDQWRWLEEALRRSTATVNIVVQGLQVHAEHMFNGNIAEEWSLFPKSQNRLYQALLLPNVNAPILVSGDVHMFQLSQKDCRKVTKKDYQYVVDGQMRPLLEVTTSGLTHAWGSRSCARPRENFICTSPYLQQAIRLAAHWAHLCGAWTELVYIDGEKTQEGAKGGMQYSILQNFAEFEFDWDAQEVIIRAFGDDINSPPLSSTTWNFTFLTGPNDDHNLSPLKTAEYSEQFQTHVQEESGDWVCINHRGTTTLARKIYGVAGPSLIILSAILFPLIFPILVMFTLMKFKGNNKQKIKSDHYHSQSM